jgi:tRNA G18 (ribose-2'-O)-methylase SpoU
VTDPHNLGACLRVADGAGAHAVIAPKDHAVGVNATVAKVASGAAAGRRRRRAGDRAGGRAALGH